LYYQSTDRVGGVAAVSEKILEIRVPCLLGVASEGAKEGLKTAHVEVVTSNFRGASAQGPVGSVASVYSIEKSVFPFADGAGALRRRGLGLFFVGHVIRDTDHGIDCGERSSRRSRQQPRADREVFVVAVGEFFAAFEIRTDGRSGGVGDD